MQLYRTRGQYATVAAACGQLGEKPLGTGLKFFGCPPDSASIREQSQSRAINVGAWSLLWNKSPLHTVYKRRRTATARHGPSACRYCRNRGQPSVNSGEV